MCWLSREECGRETWWGHEKRCPGPVTGRAGHRCSAFTELSRERRGHAPDDAGRGFPSSLLKMLFVIFYSAAHTM